MKNGLTVSGNSRWSFAACKFYPLIFAALGFLMPFNNTFATTYTSFATGNWSSSGTWSPSGVPGSHDNVIIHGGHVITADGTDSCINLTIGDATSGNTTLQISAAGNSINVSGALSINPSNINKTYLLNAGRGTLNISGTFAWGTSGTNEVEDTTGTVTFAPSVTIAYSNQTIVLAGAGTINFNSSFTDNYNKLTTFTGATINFASNYTVSTTTASWAGKGTAVFSNTGTITANSNLTLFNLQTATSASTTLASAVGSVVIGGAIALGSGSTFKANENFELDGNLTNSGGTFNAGSNTLYLNGTTTISSASTMPLPYLQMGLLTTTTTVAATLSCNSTCLGLTYTGYNRARTLTITTGDTLTVNGNVLFNQPASASTNGLSVNGGICILNGNLTFTGTVTTASYISRVAVTTGLLAITGNVSYDANTVAANQVITISSTGTINFSKALTIASGTLSNTSTGTFNFNGSAPSLTFGGSNNPLFSTTTGSVINLANGFVNNTNTLTFGAASNTYFTGSGTITANAAINFGNIQMNATDTLASTGAVVNIAGNCTLALGSAFKAFQNFELTGNWVNSGGTLTGSNDTLILIGSAKTLGGAYVTNFPVIQVGMAASAAVSYTLNTADTCAGLIFYSRTVANTFTQAANFTVNGNVTINQPTAAVTNSLVINGYTCRISGNVYFPGTTTTASYIALISETTGSLTIGGSITWGSNATAANAVITASTGTLNFSSPIVMTAGTISLTRAGNINFNGSAPSLTFGGSSNPVLTTYAACNVSFANGLKSITTALTLNAASNSIFTGNGTITPGAVITFGNFQLNTGVKDSLAGNINVAGNWVNNGGTFNGSADTVFFTGTGKTIGGTTSTTFPVMQIGTSTSGGISSTLNKSALCSAFIIYGGAAANTFTIAATSDTLTISGNLTVNQPTAAVTNALADNGILNISGNLNFPGTTATASYIAKITIGNGNSALNLTGNVNWGNLATAANAVISLGTGTINFSSRVVMTGGTIAYTAAGTINFNGASPSFTFGSTNPVVLTTVSNCNINFLHGFTNNTALVLNVSSNTNFNGAGSITPTAAITFGRLTINSNDTLLTGANAIAAGNFTLSSAALFFAQANFEVRANWVNNGGTLSGTTYTVFFNGTTQTISGSATSFQTLQIGNSTIANTVAVTMNCNNSCQAFIFHAGTTARTFTITAADTLNINGTLTNNQPAGTVINNLAVGAGACTITGGLNFVGTSNTTTHVSEVTVTTGSLNVAGAVSWMANTAVATEIISVTSGTLTFGSSLSMPTGSGTLSVTGAATVNFNGSSAPSFNFGGAATSPTFTTTNGCTLNFKNGFTNNSVALTLAATSTAVFTGSGTITPSAAITFGHILINSGSTVTLAGSISLKGNWTDNGAFTPATYLVTFNATSPAVQTINNKSPETFYQLTGSVAGATVQLMTNVIVTNQLNMTGSYFNLNGYTLTLGNGAGAVLSRTSSQAYGGTFKRYIPSATAINGTSGSYYGLFPIGSSTAYTPVVITSTANATLGGYISAVFNPSGSVNVVSYTDNEGSAIQVVGAMNAVLSNSGLTGGTYNIACSYSGFSTTGVITDLKLETYTGAVMGSVGTSATSTGTVPAPTVYRNGLTSSQLANTWIVGSKNISNTPLQQFYYSRKTGNWDDVTPGNSTWSYTAGGAGVSCNCVPTANSYVTISPGQTVTADLTVSADYIDIDNGATLTDNSLITLTCNKTINIYGTGQIVNSGTWNLSGPVNFSTASSYTSAGSVTVGGTASFPAGSTYTQTSGSLSLGADAALNGTVTLGSGSLNLTGTASNISGTGSVLTTGSGTVSITNGKNILSGSNLTFGSASAPLSVTLSGAQNVTNNGTIIINGDLIGTAAGSLFTNGASSVLEVSGNMLTTGSLSAETSPNTVIYNGTGSQSIDPSTAGYVTLIMANGGVKSLSANTIISHDLFIQDSAVLNESTYTLSGAGNLTMTGNSELRLTRSTSGTYPELGGVFTLAGGTLSVNQTSGTAGFASIPYSSLKFTGSANYDISTITTIYNSFYVQGSSVIINNTNNLYVADSLIYSSSATSTLNDDISVGSLTLTAGTLNDGGNNINIYNTAGLNNNGGSLVLSGSVNFYGRLAQYISGSVPTLFNNLNMSCTSSVTLNQNISVSNTLNLNSGILYTSTGAILTMLPGATYTGGSSSSFISGPMYKTGNDDFIFPIGKGGLYSPAGVSGIINITTQVYAEYFNNPYSSLTPLDPKLTQVSPGEYWEIERTVTSDSMQVQLFWSNSVSYGLIDCKHLTIAHYTGGTWISEPAAVLSGSLCWYGGSGSIQTTGYVSTFSPFTFGGSGGTSLPIKLLSFNAEADKNVVLTTWQTELEINNAYFTVERSADAQTFDSIGTIEGAGNSSEERSYQFTDETPLNGVSYYRLRQTDYNGNFTFSNPVAVNFLRKENFTVFPNPASDQVFISISNPVGQVLVNLFDITGKLILTKTITADDGGNNQIIPLSIAGKLPGGIYIVSVLVNMSEYNQKLIVK